MSMPRGQRTKAPLPITNQLRVKTPVLWRTLRTRHFNAVEQIYASFNRCLSIHDTISCCCCYFTTICTATKSHFILFYVVAVVVPAYVLSLSYLDQLQSGWLTHTKTHSQHHHHRGGKSHQMGHARNKTEKNGPRRKYFERKVNHTIHCKTRGRAYIQKDNRRYSRGRRGWRKRKVP